jgi:hypothetical protein
MFFLRFIHCCNIGMWFERFVIIVTSLHRDYLPSSWTMLPTFVDIGFYRNNWFLLYCFYCTLGLFCSTSRDQDDIEGHRR